MVVSRMRARINNVELPDGVVESALPSLHPRVAAAANVLDTYAYTTSILLRGPHLAETFNPGSMQTFSQYSMGLTWDVQGPDFWASQPTYECQA